MYKKITIDNVDRYRHRTTSPKTNVDVYGLPIVSLCGKVWHPICAGHAARRYPKCPTCFAEPSRERVVA